MRIWVVPVKFAAGVTVTNPVALTDAVSLVLSTAVNELGVDPDAGTTACCSVYVRGSFGVTDTAWIWNLSVCPCGIVSAWS